ncbi:MAG: TlyA family RNA methyltransferase [Candidatus Hinthialibacter antarcticus]|nr:TlyA family RNA methyltransferase [Candidatus Hinthialibacter antarcticus]
MAKQRLDALLASRGLAPSRETAQRYIRAGEVLVDETVFDKPGVQVDEDAVIRLTHKECDFASRGGLKLEKALNAFDIDVSGWTTADFGASNGGFTDCLLRRGAVKVFAIDVGHGQLAYNLQTDPRVVVMDKTNCRYVTQDDLGETVDLVTADLSFISIEKVLPAMQSILKPGGSVIVLVKPQFEIGKGKVGKKGVVRRREDHQQVLEDCYDAYTAAGWRIVGAAVSPITGKSGNIEFLYWMRYNQDQPSINRSELTEIVNNAHENK